MRKLFVFTLIICLALSLISNANTLPTADVIDIQFETEAITNKTDKGSVTMQGSVDVVLDETIGKHVGVYDGTGSAIVAIGYDKYAELFTDKITIETYLKLDEFPSSFWDPIGGTQAGGTSLEITSSGKIEVYIATVQHGGYVNPAPTSATLETNKYYHIVYTYDGSKIVLYIDGQKVDEVESSGNIIWPNEDQYPGAAAFGIGGDVQDQGDVDPITIFKGRMAIARVYSSALTAEQVTSLYNEAIKVESETETQNPQTDGNSILMICVLFASFAVVLHKKKVIN